MKKNIQKMIRVELSLFLLVALLASALTLSHAQTVLAAATVNYAYTATNWAVSHYTCTTDPRSGYQYPHNDYINLANPSAATISTGTTTQASLFMRQAHPQPPGPKRSLLKATLCSAA